jgi:hypothetical protein
MDILLIAVVGTLNIACFFIGAKVGQMVQKGETIKAPTINPVKLYNEHTDRKEAEAEKNRLDVIMRNIERYDGTGTGQEDVPR